MTVGIANTKQTETSASTNQDLFLPTVVGNVSQMPVITDSKPPNFQFEISENLFFPLSLKRAKI